VRCGPYKLLNPNYKEPAVKLSERRRATPGPRSEVIELDDSPGSQTITPARRRGLATQIPTIPNFKLGYTEKERQQADQRVIDRKTKTGYLTPIPTVHFSIGVAHFIWDELSEDQGH